jgi:ABC-type uncharacterized transport system permease subunit
MSEAIGQPGGAAPVPMGLGEILSTAFQLYQRHWRTLLAIAVAVVISFTLLQNLLGNWVRDRGEVTSSGLVVDEATWSVGLAGLVAALAGVVMFLVLTGAITRVVPAEVAGKDPGSSRATGSASTGWGRCCYGAVERCATVQETRRNAKPQVSAGM